MGWAFQLAEGRPDMERGDPARVRSVPRWCAVLLAECAAQLRALKPTFRIIYYRSTYPLSLIYPSILSQT